MKSKTNPAAIGIFIAGAIVLLFASLVVFGSGRFFRKTKDILLTFREPVTGLDIGAPVKLMGVTVGSVKQINLAVGNDPTNTLLISVIVEIDLEGAQSSFRGHQLDLNNHANFQKMVEEHGLCGQLEVLSLLSGQLYIALDMVPDREGFLLGRANQTGLWEIPTIPSTKREMMRSLVTSLNNLAELDFQGLSSELKSLLQELRADLAKFGAGEIGTNLVQVLQHTRSIVGNPQFASAVTNLNSSLAQLDQLTRNLNNRMDPLLADADMALKKVAASLDDAGQALRALKSQVEPGSDVTRELINTLDRAGQAMNALRQLAEQLQRNPSSIITGKKESTP